MAKRSSFEEVRGMCSVSLKEVIVALQEGDGLLKELEPP